MNTIQGKAHNYYEKLTPQRILEVFDGTQWDDRTDAVYENLHPKVRQVMDGWMIAHEQEMKTVLREIRINEITNPQTK